MKSLYALLKSPTRRKYGKLMRTIAGTAMLALSSVVAVPAAAQDASIVVSSTTSTEQSGLFGFILP